MLLREPAEFQVDMDSEEAKLLDNYELELSSRSDPEKAILPITEPLTDFPPATQRTGLHPAWFIASWIALSSAVILFNKYILSSAGFPYPVVLTAWHLSFATICTQIMARCSTMLDSRKKIQMDAALYLQKIVPIGLMFSVSLMCGNQTYLYLSVSFIQMLKATMPVVTLLTGWLFKLSAPSLSKLGIVSFIVMGVVIASVGEVEFVFAGFFFQCSAILAEAFRLVLVEELLSGSQKMDPLVSLYYFAPLCAVLNAGIALFTEIPRIDWVEVENVGIFILLLNATVALLLNVSSVVLIAKTSSLVITLCGVLKPILLVGAAMVLFGDYISPLQAFGYSIALCGLLYYEIGGEKLRRLMRSGLRTSEATNV